MAIANLIMTGNPNRLRVSIAQCLLACLYLLYTVHVLSWNREWDYKAKMLHAMYGFKIFMHGGQEKT